MKSKVTLVAKLSYKDTKEYTELKKKESIEYNKLPTKSVNFYQSKEE